MARLTGRLPKGKPTRARPGERARERRDCTHYRGCLDVAADACLPAVPCADCSAYVKAEARAAPPPGAEIQGVTISPCRDCTERVPGCRGWCRKLPQNRG